MGQSSLLRLHSLPVTELKIDRSFVLGLDEENPDSEVIVRSIINLSHSLGLRVVAEGVETTKVEALLKSMGCDWAQGWLYERAVPATDVAALFSEPKSEYPDTRQPLDWKAA